MGKKNGFHVNMNKYGTSYSWNNDTIHTDVVNASATGSSQYDDIIRAIKKIQRTNTLSTLLMVLGILTPAFPPMVISLLLGIVIKIIAHTKMPIRMFYTFDESAQASFQALTDMWANLSKCKKFWQINTATAVKNKKAHGGAGTTVTRTDAKVATKCPYYLKLNVKPFGLEINEKRVLFLPDKVLVIDGKKIGILSYDDVHFQMGKTRFIESDAVPGDAKVLGETWLKVNKDGSPDKRYKGNRRVPICEYGEVEVSSGEMLNVAVMCSNSSMIDEMRVLFNQAISTSNKQVPNPELPDPSDQPNNPSDRHNERAKKGIFTKKFLKIPIWLWIIIAVFVIRSATNKAAQPPVSGSEQPTPTATSTIAPSDAPTLAPTAEPSVSPTTTPTETPREEIAGQSDVEAFIEGYNQTAPNPITDTREIDVTNKSSGHYRTEFRLGAYEDSYAQTGKIGEITIDIIAYGYGKNDDMRLYADGLTFDQAVEIITYSFPLLDPELTNAELQEAIQYVNENKEANGRYYGDLGLVLLGKYSGNYELMIKCE